MNRAELVEAMAAEYDGNKTEAAKALDAVVRSISYELAAGGKVAIAGFGILEAVTPPRGSCGTPRPASSDASRVPPHHTSGPARS